MWSFPASERGDFSKNSDILQFAKMGPFSGYLVTLQQLPFAAVLLAILRPFPACSRLRRVRLSSAMTPMCGGGYLTCSLPSRPSLAEEDTLGPRKGNAHKKKGDVGSCVELIIAPSPCCDVPSRTLPRIVPWDQLISVCTRNKYNVAQIGTWIK